jgi:AICAR transformylase/IMP cyclohydrolase PurH
MDGRVKTLHPKASIAPSRRLRSFAVRVSHDGLTLFSSLGSGFCCSKVHGGIMAVRGNKEHAAAAEAAGIQEIDLVVLNL